MKPIRKISAKERARLNRLRNRVNARVRGAIDSLIEEMRSDKVTREVIRLLEANDMNGIMQLLDKRITATSRVLPQVFTEAGIDEASDLAGKILAVLPETTGASVGFDPSHPRAAELMRRNRLEWVKDFSDKQRRATRLKLTQALREGQGPRGAARAFRDSIGLTETQLQHVNNYRRSLENLQRHALDYDTRDRRSDRKIERAIENDKPLSQADIDRMTGRMEQNYRQFRAEMIARTETGKVLGQARQEALAQSLEDADLTEDDYERVWDTNLDGRERATHAAADGQRVKGEEPFTVGGYKLQYPGDSSAPAEEIINCRCDYHIEFKSVAER